MPRAQGVRGGGTSIPLLSGSCLPMVLPSQPGWGAQGMEVGTLGQARKRKAGAPGSEPPGPGFPPLSSSGRGGGCSASVSPSAWGEGGPPSAREESGEEAGGARTDTSIPPHRRGQNSGRSRAPRREGGLDAGSRLPEQCSAPAAASGGLGAPGAHPLGSPRRRHISAPARGPRGRLSGAREAAGGLGAPLPSRSAAAARPHPRRAHFPPGARARRPRFPSPPGRPCPGRAQAAGSHPGRSDRLGRPSWPARLSHGAGPTPTAWHTELSKL